MTETPRLHRRDFLTRGAIVAGAMTVAGPFNALLARGPQHPRQCRGPSPDYGPLQPAIDETTGLPLLLLSADFRYLSFGWTGEMMHDGILTPNAHDGMAAFPGGHGRVYLIRNHEVGEGPDAFAPAIAYDEQAGGGTTQRGGVRAWPDHRRRHLPVRTEQRRLANHAGQRFQLRLPRFGVCRRLLQPRRQVALFQYPVARDQLRRDWAVGERRDLIDH